ncbi:hypothetical protein GGH12_001223 [Coemansia sp. RSA 1822]|nr:hypothetical protein LPJ76_001096 [Coemansia sp. RSA 638]KAJ2122274.1 hypothetical protein IW147_003570 [Coemansia sp. RSA 720]KAJ2544199.1 hypothetical protein GGF49_001437 [Coemansia sp. RSA 1853]KAJ2565790.1 hypothetical protein GGH12_001223 [Coemansia sp. RSA 1822]
MAESSNGKRVRFAETSHESRHTPDDEYDSDVNAELEADITSSRRRNRRVQTDGYDSETSDQDSLASDIDAEADKSLRAETAESDDDMFGTTSNSEDKKRKRTDGPSLDEVEGQELSSVTRTETGDAQETKIEAFNMRDDLEDGSFDASGTFVWNKRDPQSYQDEWLNDVSHDTMQRARESQSKHQSEQHMRAANAEQQWSLIGDDDLALAIINMLQPRETVFAALARIGNTGAKSKKNKKKKWGKKEMDPEDMEKERVRKQGIERLTELADQAMARGMPGVYDDSYEQMVRRMRVAGRIPDDWMPGTMLQTAAQLDEQEPNNIDSEGLLDDIL